MNNSPDRTPAPINFPRPDPNEQTNVHVGLSIREQSLFSAEFEQALREYTQQLVQDAIADQIMAFTNPWIEGILRETVTAYILEHQRSVASHMDQEVLNRFDKLEERIESKIDKVSLHLEEHINIVKTDLEKQIGEVKSDIDKKQARSTSWWQTLIIVAVTLLGIIITAVIAIRH